MAVFRSGPSLGKLGVLIVVLIAGVLFYQKLSSLELDLLSKQSSNRVYYERLYSEANDEIADWRRRYDNETARAQEHLEVLSTMKKEAKLVLEEKERLRAELDRLTEQLKRVQHKS